MWKVVSVLFLLILSVVVYVVYLCTGNASFGFVRESVGGGNYTFGNDLKVEDPKNGSVKHHVPKFMLDLYEKSFRSSQERGGRQPDVVKSVVPKGASLTQHLSTQDFQDNHLLVFEVPSTNDDEEFLSAELKILTIVEVDDASLNGLQRIIKVSVYDDVTEQLSFLDQVHVRHMNNTWLSFNMTRAVDQVLGDKQRKSLLKVVISVRAFLPYIENKFRLSLLPVGEELEHDYPLLLLTYSSKKPNAAARDSSPVAGEVRRTKRNTEEDYEEETNNIWDEEVKKANSRKHRRLRNTCKRKPLYVDFSEIEYNTWIVQPAGYEAYQCQGKCFYPVAEHLSPTKHAIVQALLHSVSPAKAARSCCVPTKLDSISVLYIDKDGVLTYRYAYSEMVVTECGCR